jgi:hypothetical protein
VSATIKQPKGSGMCAVCVAAMATNTTTDQVYEFLNDGRTHGEPIHDPELAMYLLKHGWLMGRGFQLADEEADRGMKLSGPDKLTMFVPGILGQRAYLAVKSRNYEGVNHAVYWNGISVQDPDPGMPDETEITDYELVQVWPFTFLGHTNLTRRLTCEPSEVPFFVKRWRQSGIPEVPR